MTEVVETVGQLLGIAGGGLGEVELKWLDQTEALAEVRTALQAFPSLLGAGVAADLAEAIKAVLAIRLGDVLAEVWNTRRDLKEFLDPKKHPPDELSELVLGEQQFHRTLTPRIEIQVDGTRITELDLEISLELKVEAVVLRIRDTRIMSARTGTCEGKATLNLRKAILPSPKARRFNLPGTLSFGEGVKIRELALLG